MLVIMAALFVVHMSICVMLLVATISNVWEKESNGVVSYGIWSRCENERCISILDAYSTEHPAIKAVEAFMILAIIFCFFSLFSFIGQLFMLEKGRRFFATGALMLLTFLCILIAISIYTSRFATPNTYHAYCYILTWICFCLSFILGILYLILRKK